MSPSQNKATIFFSRTRSQERREGVESRQGVESSGEKLRRGKNILRREKGKEEVGDPRYEDAIEILHTLLSQPNASPPFDSFKIILTVYILLHFTFSFYHTRFT